MLMNQAFIEYMILPRVLSLSMVAILDVSQLSPFRPFWFCAATTIQVSLVTVGLCVCCPFHPHRFINIEIKSVKFEDSLFEDCHFEDIKSTDTVFENCTIRSTVFYDTGRFIWSWRLKELRFSKAIKKFDFYSPQIEWTTIEKLTMTMTVVRYYIMSVFSQGSKNE